MSCIVLIVFSWAVHLHHINTHLVCLTSLPGLPEIEEKGPLQALATDLSDLRKNLQSLLLSWEKDNSLVYFDKVPPSVPSSKALKPILLQKIDEFKLEAREPLPFSIPALSPPPPSYEDATNNGNQRDRSDSDLARELHEKLNSEHSA